MDRITLRTGDEDGQAPTDQRAVAAGFLAVLDQLARPKLRVLLAIDDLQWLDSSSVHVLEFVARRLRGPIGLLGAVRTMSAQGSAWFQPPQPDRLHRITLHPLTVGALHAVLSQRLGHSYPRPTMLRIHQTSGGNPFYAIELARSIDERGSDTKEVLPRSLTELMDRRIDSVEERAERALLASRLPRRPDDRPRRRGDGHPGDRSSLRYSSPRSSRASSAWTRIASGSPIRCSPRGSTNARRRPPAGPCTAGSPSSSTNPNRRPGIWHWQPRRGDPATLKALDAAADIARSRGAPDASAELVNLAIALGGDTPERRIQLAGLHFNSGTPSGRAPARRDGRITRRRRAPFEGAVPARRGPNVRRQLHRGRRPLGTGARGDRRTTRPREPRC